MSVSDDIGSLVLVLAEHAVQRYDPEAPRREQEQIERYFAQMEYLLRHTKDPVAFGGGLSPFQRSVTELTKHTCEELGDALDGQRLVGYFLTSGTLLSGGMSIYAFLTGQNDVAAGGLVTAVCLLIGQGYMCMKQHATGDAYKRVVRCDETTHRASADEWREAFTLYHPMLSEEVVDFNHLIGPGTSRRKKRKAKV